MKDRYYAQLKFLRSELISNHGYKEESIALPFSTYVGCRYKEMRNIPRVMFVGKATAGWDRPEGQSHKFINEVKSGRYPWGQFWPFIIDLVPKIYGACRVETKMDREWVLDRIVWSNLTRLGSGGGNPSGKLYKCQRNVCRDALKSELNELQPTCVVLVTGGFYTSLVKEIFGDFDCRTKNQIADDNLWVKDLCSDFGKGRVYWSRHPQGWKTEFREQAKEFIGHDQAKFLNAKRE